MPAPSHKPVAPSTCSSAASRHERKIRRMIAKADASGRPKRTAYWMRRSLASCDARLVAALVAYRKLKPHRRPPRRPRPTTRRTSLPDRMRAVQGRLPIQQPIFPARGGSPTCARINSRRSR